MAVGHRHPTDVLVDELSGLYAANARRLEGIVRDGLRRGLDASRLGTGDQRVGDATHAYRQRQLAQARAVLGELDAQVGRAGPLIIGRAYGSGLVTADRALIRNATARAGVAGSFGRIHVRAVEALAQNMEGSLRAASDRARANVATVFARADAIEGALSGAGTVAGVPFLGRRQDDPYRRVALELVGGGLIGLDTRRQVSEGLVRRLLAEGITDALTGFVDRSGRRWSLASYASMVARTTTREATTAGTVNRLVEHGVDLVAISRHDHAADECTPYDGQTFSLSGASSDFPVLDRRPPFHPNCRHVLGPADADLDAYEAELARAADGATTPQPAAPPRVDRAPPPPAAPDTPPAAAQAVGVTRTPFGELRAPVAGLVERPRTPPDPPFGEAPGPRYGETSSLQHEADRVAELIAGDPGPEPDAFDAVFKDALRDERRRVAALKASLGDELGTYVFGGRGKRPRAFAVEEDLKGKLLRGEVTLDEVEELVSGYEEDLYREAQERELRRRPKVRPCPCFNCGRFKPRASSVCDNCGDDPVVLESASDFAQAGYVEGAGGTRYEEGAGIQEARRRLDMDVYGLDPDDPTLDPDGPAIGISPGAYDAYAKGARRRRALNASRNAR